MSSEKFIFQTKTKTGQTVSFRYPTIADAQILMNYINKLSAEKSFILFQGEQQTLKREKKWLQEKIKAIKKNKAVFVLAFINENLIGLSDVELQPMAKNHVGDFGITVAQKYRGKGIGKILMDLIISQAIKKIKKLKIITLECFATNDIGLGLYKKMGFIEYGRLTQGLKRRGKFCDSILMYKKIK